LRNELGLDPDPVAAFRAGGYAERLALERRTPAVKSTYERLPVNEV